MVTQSVAREHKTESTYEGSSFRVGMIFAGYVPKCRWRFVPLLLSRDPLVFGFTTTGRESVEQANSNRGARMANKAVQATALRAVPDLCR